MAKTIINLSDTISTFVNKSNTISNTIGDLAALNTTEDSDIGSAQNILGNIQVTKAIQGPSYDYSNCNVVSIVDNAKNPGFRYAGTNKHIAHAVDPQSDKLYRFINTEPTAENPHGVWMDRIVRLLVFVWSDPKETPYPHSSGTRRESPGDRFLWLVCALILRGHL